MAPPSSVLSQTIKSVSLTKIRELEKQRERYESQKNEVLAASERHPNDIRERITELLRGVKSLCASEETDNFLVSLASPDHRVANIDLWLQQSSYDASVSSQMLQLYEELLRSRLEVQSRKLGIGYLWTRLVTEWMSSSAPMGEVPDNGDGPSDADRREKHLKALCEKFEEVVFTPLVTDEARIEQYLEGLFAGDEGSKALDLLRQRIGMHERILLRRHSPFDLNVLGWCINGLLAEDLLSDEKQAVLRDFLKDKVVLGEIADVLNMRFADFDNWSWEAGELGIPVLPRPQLNGKYRIWMDEDVLQAIFIHYIGIKNCVELKSVLNSILQMNDGPWDWSAGKSMSSADRVRHEFFTGMKLYTGSTLNQNRKETYRDSFFVSQLPAAVTTIGRFNAYVNDGGVADNNGDENERRTESTKTEHVNIKQKLLRTLASEAIVHRTLYGEAAVVQSDLQWYATGLSHATIFAVMRFLGFSERLVSFYRKVLQAPLNMVSEPGCEPSGEPRIRQRGVPMAHAPEKFTGEMILFIMDLAVNKATGMLLYRLHDDLFLCGEPQRCAQAWREMETFAEVMGVEFNAGKTGSVYLSSPEKGRDTEVEDILPNGFVRIGHLLLDPDSGEWILDQPQINEHVAQLQKQLAACESILDWVTTWNSCISRFFSHTLGEPAACFGQKHVDSVLQTYQRILTVLFEPAQVSEEGENRPTTGGNVIDFIKSKISERFGFSDVPDVFIFLPEQMGGLGVKNPFIPYLAYRNTFIDHEKISSPDKIMRTYLASEKENYEKAYKLLRRLSAEDRLTRLHALYGTSVSIDYGLEVLGNALIPREGDDFFSFEDYLRHRESTSNVLNAAYSQLLEVPRQRGATSDIAFISEALRSAGIWGQDDAKLLQVKWVLQMYQNELQERWGGTKLVDEKYLPLGLLTMVRRKTVRWTMVL